MFFFLAYLLLVFGMVLAGIIGLMPLDTQIMIPDVFRYLMFFMGFILAFVGLVLLHMRAIKIGAQHLIAPGRPENILWFYVYRDGTIKITPSIRVVEGQLYSKELDAQISELKSYRLMDHSVRFVPEGVGSSMDLDLCTYAYVLKTKYGFSNLKESRQGILGLKTSKILKSKEHIMSGAEMDKIQPEQPDKSV